MGSPSSRKASETKLVWSLIILGSWAPVQLPTAAPLGASTVSTLDTASTVQGTPAHLPAAILNPDQDVIQAIQEILRNALEALMEERRRQPQPTNRGERPMPKMPQMLQSLRGLPEKAGVAVASTDTQSQEASRLCVGNQHGCQLRRMPAGGM